MIDQLIINTEYFLGCAGSCAGCFLTLDERNSKSNYHDLIDESLNQLLKDKLGNSSSISDSKSLKKDFLVIGFGRGNNLNLDKLSLTRLGEIIKSIENKYPANKLVFEVSSSLIGKIQSQIDNALFLLEYSQNIYFNVVVNSEITSGQFWNNLKEFHSALTQKREGWGWSDNTGDILVLNINPRILPSVDRLEEFSRDIHSPINISLFPFENNKSITSEELNKLKLWTKQAAQLFRDKDFNIKNYLAQYTFNLDNMAQVFEHIEITKNTYFFIDKNGEITNGIPSIMGEVDFPRLLDKYNLKPDIKAGFRAMQKQSSCSVCQYQKECLVSGGYLNMLANVSNFDKENYNNEDKKDNFCCPSGYYEFFEEFKAS